jgi:hypothetical protein
MAKSSTQVRKRTRGSQAANAFASALTRQIARDTGKIADYLAVSATPAGMQDLVDNVSYPEFVATLIEGTFNAAVDASIQQMEAYAELVKDVARTVDQFAKDNASAEQARDRLAAKYPELIDDADDRDSDDDGTRKKAARTRRKRLTHKERRRLIAKATLMGINRIVVTSGRVKARRRA